MTDAAMVSALLTRREAARYLSVSLRYFQRNIRPVVTRVQIGALVRYEREALDQWIAEHRVNDVDAARARWESRGRTTTRRASAGVRSAPPDFETRKIVEELRRQVERSRDTKCAAGAASAGRH
jgi:excisionase family DNA binding protein